LTTPTCGEPCEEVPGAETETAEHNGPETEWQIIWNDLPDETVRKFVLRFADRS